MKVSVIIPVYNAARFLEDAVRSALAQPEVAEIVLAEDASTDDSLSICRRLVESHETVMLVRHPDGKNHGPGATRNLGLRRATCDYIAFLDADDFFLPGRFRAAGRLFEADPSIDGVYEAARNVFDDEALRTTYANPELYSVAEGVAPEDLFEVLVSGGKGCFPTDGLTFKRRLLERTGEFDVTLPGGEDTAMWIRMAASGRLVAGSITEPVTIRRLHGGNIVFARKAEYPAYRSRAWEGLVRWGRKNGLSRRRMLLLVDAWVEQWCSEVPPSRGWTGTRERLGRIWFLLRLALKHPWAVSSRQYRGWVASLSGWRRIRKTFAREEPR